MKLVQIKNEKGAALITALLVITLLTIIGISATKTTDIEQKIAGNEKISVKALYAAEAGIQAAIADLRTNHKAWDSKLTDPDDPWGDNPLFTAQAIGEGTYDVIVLDNDDGDSNMLADSDDIVIIRSTGTVYGSVKNIEVVFSKDPIDVPDPDGGLSFHDKGGSKLDFFGGG